MNCTALFLLGSLILLFNCTAVHAQGCATTLQAHFSVYNTVSRDGTHIYTSVAIQGYASVFPGPGCPMNTATHHVGAENRLNNVDHWTYSANGCPTCYFSATDGEQIVGVPGVVYPFVWDGVAICSLAGSFFGGGGSGSLPGCVVPSHETTAVESTVFVTLTDFNQTISDTAKDLFNGATVTEGNAAPGQDTCWGTWSIGPRFTGIKTNPPSAWIVGGGEVLGAPNHWGFDQVGWIQTAVDYYRVNAPQHGVAIPCGFTGYQSMTISCPSGKSVTYTPSVGNKLTGTIEQHAIVNCRYDMDNTACQTINY
jgi:hypothetical protein